MIELELLDVCVLNINGWDEQIKKCEVAGACSSVIELKWLQRVSESLKGRGHL
jgi:hypothetical protein